MVSAKGGDSRYQAMKKLASSSGGAIETAPVLREVGRRYFACFCAALAAAVLGVGARALTAPIDDWKIAGPFGGTATTVAVDPETPRTVLAGARNSLLYQSTDSGVTWATLDLPKSNLGEVTSILVDPSNSRHYLVGVLDAFGGGLFESFDAGKTWAPNLSFNNVGVRALAAATSQPGQFVAGTLQGVLLSANSGKDWQRISSPNNLEMQGITAVAIDPKDSNIIYAGTPHLPWRTADAGKTWQSIHSGMIDDSDVFSIYIDPKKPAAVFASACSGIYSSPNRGGSWTKLAGIPNTSRRTHVIREDPARPGTIYAGTTMGLFRSPNAGINWTVLTSTQVNALAFDPAQPASMYLAMEYQGVAKSVDGGDTIKLIDDGFVDRQISSVTRSGGKLVAIETQVAATTGIFVSSDSGAIWSQLENVKGLDGVHLRSIAGLSSQDKTLLAASPRGLHRSVDGGVLWQPLAPQEAVVQPVPRVHSKTVVKKPAKPRVYMRPLPPCDIYGLFSVKYADKDYLAMATEIGLFFSEDEGGQWKRSDLGYGTGAVVALYLSPANDGRLVAKTPTSLYVSKDNGAQWTRITFPLPINEVNWVALASDPGAPLLVATRVGLYLSPDGGFHWYERPPGLGNSTVSAVTYSGTGRTAYAVEYGQLYRSNDGGMSWSQMPTALRGLPIRRLWVPDNTSTRLYAITSGLGILFRD